MIFLLVRIADQNEKKRADMSSTKVRGEREITGWREEWRDEGGMEGGRDFGTNQFT